jgi:hypothetical protein
LEEKMTCERICRYDAEGQSKVADDDTKIVKKFIEIDEL